MEKKPEHKMICSYLDEVTKKSIWMCTDCDRLVEVTAYPRYLEKVIIEGEKAAHKWKS